MAVLDRTEGQKVFVGTESVNEWFEEISTRGFSNIFLVCSGSFARLSFASKFEKYAKNHDIEITKFLDFSPNPSFEQMESAKVEFCRSKCEMIMAVGGGSAIDVAKCVRGNDDIFFAAVPTTGGSGSEATHFAVVYKYGKKLSLEFVKGRPDLVLLDETVLETLPEYQRKSTLMDSFCHAIEAFWSKGSSAISREYSKEAIGLILKCYDSYIDAGSKGNKKMFTDILITSYRAGQAINLAKTTAAHAMSYILSMKYGISHGHAAALCLKELFAYMVGIENRCIDKRGIGFYCDNMLELAKALGCESVAEAADKVRFVIDRMGFDDLDICAEDVDELVENVNTERLGNFPLRLDEGDLRLIYKGMLHL